MYNPTSSNTLEGSSQTATYFLDCSIRIHSQVSSVQHQSSFESTFQWIKGKLNKWKRGDIQLKGKLSNVVRNDDPKSDQIPAYQYLRPKYPFLKYKQSNNKFFISHHENHVIRSIRNTKINRKKWNGRLRIEVGQPMNHGYSFISGSRNACILKYPIGFDWDMDDNMYICISSCICKVDSKSNQVSLVAGHANDRGYKDGNNDEARFKGPSGIVCSLQNHHQSPLVFYACDCHNHCIRMIDVTNGKTSTLAGKGKEEGDVDGTLQSARFYWPCDIVKDNENDHILYVSDSFNSKIKMIYMKKGMVSTLVGDENDKSILDWPQQMQIIDSFIYVACRGFKDCIVKVDKHSKQVTKIKFNDGEQVSSDMYGIAYHELDQCFYISDCCSIYKLE